MKRILVGLLILASLVCLAAPSFAESVAFADPAFQRTWSRTDAAVSRGKSSISWLWGPQPNSPGLREPYAESPGGTRLVQYFDKARMEINDPDADRSALWFVTNGLLPVELITGRLQVGENSFTQQEPARIAALGDPDNPFPTYADLAPLFTYEGAGDRIGNPVTGFLNRDGTISGYDAYRDDESTVIAATIKSHGIPLAFSQHMIDQSQRLNPIFVFGYPVSGAYWTQIKVNGVEQPVMFQVFERRILTYTPGNPHAFRVESGNVGQHYYQWRYGSHGTLDAAP